MPDQYEMPLLSDVDYMPTMGASSSSLEDAIQQRVRVAQQAADQQKETELRLQAAARPVAPSSGQPSQFIDWPTYQKLRSDVDPVDAYSDYVSIVAPNQLASMGANAQQIRETIDNFKQHQPEPVRRSALATGTDKGLIGNAVGAVGHELSSIKRQAAAGAAVASGDVNKLLALAQEEQAAQKDVDEAQQAFRGQLEERGSLWDYLSSIGKSAVRNREGAFDSALQTLVGFLPYMAAGTVGALGGPVGAAVSMGLTAADLEAGSKALHLLQREAANAGVNLNDAPAVSKWLKDGGAEKVFGPAAKAGLTGGALAALTMGVATKMGGGVTRLLSESGLTGDAEQAALAAGREATRTGTATSASLRRQAAALQAAEVGTAAGGFTAASALGDIAAGETPDEKAMFVNALTMLIPGAASARSRFKGAKTPEIKPVEQPTTQSLKAAEAPAKPAEAKPSVEPTEEEITAIAKQALPTEEEIKQTVEEAVAKKSDEQVTQAQIEALKDFADEDKAAAVALVQQAAKEAMNEHVEAVATQVKDEIQARREERAAGAEEPAPAVESAAPPAERAVEPATDAAIQQAVGEATGAGPVDRGRAGVVEEGVHEGVGTGPERGGPTGGIGERGAAPVAESVIPVEHAGGKGAVVEKPKPLKRASKKKTTKVETQPKPKKSPFKLPQEEDFEPDPLSEYERSNLIGWREGGDLESPVRIVDDNPIHDAIVRDIKNGEATTDRVLEVLSKSTNVPLTRVLAHALRTALRGTDIPVEYRSGMVNKKGERVGGRYSRQDGKIYLDPEFGANNRTLIHELAHAATAHAIDYATTPEQHAAVRQLRTLMHRAHVAAYGKEEMQYGFKSLHEFVAEAFSNPDFQAFLARIPWEGDSLTRNRTSVWQAFKDVVAKTISRALPGREKTVLYNALIESMDLFKVPEVKQEGARGGADLNAVDRSKSYITYDIVDTQTGRVVASYTNKNRARNEVDKRDNEYGAYRYRRQERVVEPQTKEDLDQVVRENVATARENQEKGIGHIIGTKGAVTTHRAWDNGDGTYRLYDVTPAEPNGVKASRRNVSEDEVYKQIESAGGEAEDRRVNGFASTPGNNRNQIARWKDGKLIYTAIKDDQGKWQAQTSEDLRIDSRTAPRQRMTFDSRAEAARAADKLSPHESMRASDEARMVQEQQDLLTKKGASNVVVPGEASPIMTLLTDRERPIIFTASAVDAWLKKIGLQAPPGMQILSTWMLKNSNVGRETRRMLDTEAKPLMAKARQIMKDSAWLSDRKQGYDRLDAALSALIAEHRIPKILPSYERGGIRYIDNDPLKGETPEYKALVKNHADAVKALKDLDAADPGLRQKLRDLMRGFKQFSDKTLDIEQQYGLRSAQEVAKIKRAYDIYGPLRLEGKATKKSATGQSAQGKDILARIIEQRADALMRGEDNRAINVLRFWGRVADIQNPDGSKIFKIEPVDYEHLVRDPVTDTTTVSTVVNPAKSIIFHEDGKAMRMEINNEKILKAMQHLKAPDRDIAIRKALGVAGFYTRMFSALHTSLSLAFAPRNFTRDYWTNVAQLDPRVSYGKLHAAMLSSDVWSAAFRHGFREASSLLGKDTMQGNSSAARLARDVDQHRPLIEHQYRYGVDQITSDVPTALRPSIKGKIAEYVAPGDGKLTNFISGMTHSLEAVNRIAVFEAARKSGIGNEEAAMLAKNSTVNFERHGSLSPYITPLYAFANAKMQGARTLSENLGFSPTKGYGTGGLRQGVKGLLPGTQKAESANPRTVRAAQLAFALGLAAAYVNYKSSEKDKDGRTLYGKRNEYQLDEYLHIPGLNIDLPIPQEIGAFYTAASSIGDALWGDRAGAASTPLVRFVTGMVQNFWPGGTSMHDPIGNKGEGGDYVWRLAMPTPFTTLYDNMVNMDTFGRPVNRLKGSSTIPPEQQGAQYSSPFARATAQGLHSAGIMDTSPRAVDHFLLGFFQQQRGAANAITDGNVGALLDNVFKSFHQQVYPGTVANDYAQTASDVRLGAARAKGSPLKKGEKDELVKLFDSTDNKINALTKKWNRTTDEAEKKRIDQEQNDIRLKALRRYNELTGIIQ